MARCGDLSPFRCRLKAECNDGKADGCFQYGLSLEIGSTGPVDVAEAVKLYEKACRLGSAEAYHALANLHRNGYGVQKDVRRADELDLDACMHGLRTVCPPGLGL